jgi:LacI family transcriptional regulator
MKSIASITITEVAKAAGLSAATVSRALNGHPAVTSAARARAYAAAERLGYLPDGVAGSLRSKQTFTLGLLLRDVSNPNILQINSGAAAAAASHSYMLLMCSSDWDLEAERSLIRSMARRRFAGIVALVVDDTKSDVEVAARLGIPVVLIESELLKARVPRDRVISDNFGGAAKAASYLLDLGHTRIAIISGQEQILPGRDRLTGFVETTARQIQLPEWAVCLGSFSEEHGYQSTRRLMSRTDRPTAIFAGSNQILSGVLRAIRELALRVPEDLSVIGFDDSLLSQLYQPPITVVARDLREIGREAVNLVVRRIEGYESKHVMKKVVPTRLIIRSSCSHILSQPCFQLLATGA